MPNIKSAKKRMKQSAVRNARNRSAKKELNTEYKKVIAAIDSGNVAAAEAELSAAAKLLDKTAAKRIIHRNAAARTKSRLSAKIKKLKGK